MNQVTIYKVISFILLPFAVLFGLFSFIMLFLAFANPAVLLPVCVIACFSIYSFASLIFMVKGLGRQQQCKPSLKDWIKVNGFVSGAFAVMVLINSITLLTSPKAEISKLAAQVLAAQSLNAQAISAETITGFIISLSYVLVVFAALLLAHLFINFQLIKKHLYLFGDKPE